MSLEVVQHYQDESQRIIDNLSNVAPNERSMIIYGSVPRALGPFSYIDLIAKRWIKQSFKKSGALWTANRVLCASWGRPQCSIGYLASWLSPRTPCCCIILTYNFHFNSARQEGHSAAVGHESECSRASFFWLAGVFWIWPGRSSN
jgi:hypothetical protein